MVKLQSSIPGFAYFPAREKMIPSGQSFLDGRKDIDGAEDLWRIGNDLYDLTNFANSHPGGREWILLTKGTDITEAFETHHISDKAELMLPKFFVRKSKTKRTAPFTFEADNFYKKFQRRALAALGNVNYHKPSAKSNMIADFLATTALIACLLAAMMQSWSTILIAAVFHCWTTISGHNYFHMRDNFRMYYFDISLMSSKEWRITHVMSHHMFTNTLWDYELYVFEPFLQWLTQTNKSLIPRLFGALYSPVVWMLMFYVQGFQRYSTMMFLWRKIEPRDFVPFVLPSMMCLVAPTVPQAIGVWLIITGISSLLFGFIGINAAHHHPDIFHDGDIYRDNLDWGLLELDAVRAREVVDDNHFLTMTNFGSHCLHHLLPTVDHAYLPLCQAALDETCAEFGITFNRFTWWQLVKGQFDQLGRTKPKNNSLRSQILDASDRVDVGRVKASH